MAYKLESNHASGTFRTLVAAKGVGNNGVGSHFRVTNTKTKISQGYFVGVRGIPKKSGTAQKSNPTVNASAVLKRGKSILARVKRVGNRLVIQPVERVVRRARKAVRRNPRAAKPMARYRAIIYRPDAASNLTALVEANTVTKARAMIRREYPRSKVISIKREAM